MSRIVYSSDNPPTRKGWDDFDREITEAFDREVEQALEGIGRPASFDDVAGCFPDGTPYAWILGSLRTVAQCRKGLWQLAQASVVELPHPSLTTTTSKAA